MSTIIADIQATKIQTNSISNDVNTTLNQIHQIEQQIKNIESSIQNHHYMEELETGSQGLNQSGFNVQQAQNYPFGLQNQGQVNHFPLPTQNNNSSMEIETDGRSINGSVNSHFSGDTQAWIYPPTISYPHTIQQQSFNNMNGNNPINDRQQSNLKQGFQNSNQFYGQLNNGNTNNRPPLGQLKDMVWLDVTIQWSGKPVMVNVGVGRKEDGNVQAIVPRASINYAIDTLKLFKSDQFAQQAAFKGRAREQALLEVSRQYPLGLPRKN